ncbi:TetR/AcrR family transcriptional regulator [Flavobacterium pallidum]|uniref:TetR/AcrR family transcriptional regulator n=1 Tax=Flavobacterium pallidum TaxID=2172098 RepID=A0A2S1SLA2_9FLAO|nr:TetR/AcrR family transcriptional regulator [Flavobacterium pallidum]AWI27151.1 TetR/AcrR family transcriptional regulator [Flavobacterium pallidum]
MENPKIKIIERAADLFLKLGFKSITMDDIATDMGISKKTIYKYFENKELLIEATTQMVQEQIKLAMEAIFSQNHNPVCENFEIREMFKGLFQSAHTSPLYQLRKHYPEIYHKVMAFQLEECSGFIRHNIVKGIEQGYYREDIPVEHIVKFYYALIFSINENTILEKDALVLELSALEYHTRAIATDKGIAELEKHLHLNN